MGSPEEGEKFFARFDPEARTIADPDKVFFQSFGLSRGSLWSLLGPSVWASAASSTLKGNTIGKPVGDPLMMPGLFLVADGRVEWRQKFANVGEDPDLETLEARASALSEA